MELAWPLELADTGSREAAEFLQPRSNICLDLHGDPVRARLAVFSDGNHHMALAETAAAFLRLHPAVQDVFFLTTPPRVAAEWLQRGALRMGNLVLALAPHVVLGPPAALERLRGAGRLGTPRTFARSLGNALLVAAGNPRGIRGVADLARPDTRVFLSNPRTESVSYAVYAETLRRLARRDGVALDFLERPEGASHRVVYGESIHHREAPQALVDGRADVAVVFHHLALRYTRVFPDAFEAVPLTVPGRHDPDNLRSEIAAGLWGDGGAWGEAFAQFLHGPEVSAIYRHHGLDPAAEG
jgi:hypothetical protein